MVVAWRFIASMLNLLFPAKFIVTTYIMHVVLTAVWMCAQQYDVEIEFRRQNNNLATTNKSQCNCQLFLFCFVFFFENCFYWNWFFFWRTFCINDDCEFNYSKSVMRLNRLSWRWLVFVWTTQNKTKNWRKKYSTQKPVYTCSNVTTVQLCMAKTSRI